MEGGETIHRNGREPAHEHYVGGLARSRHQIRFLILRILFDHQEGGHWRSVQDFDAIKLLKVAVS
jgi:hypothetical protein